MFDPAALVIARREFWERVRTKWFLVVTILGPLLMIGLVVVPAMVARMQTGTSKVVVVSQASKEATVKIVGALGALPHMQVEPAAPHTTEGELRHRIKDKKLTGWLSVPANFLHGGEVVYHGADATNLQKRVTMQAALQSVATTMRAEDAGLSAEKTLALLEPVSFRRVLTTGTGRESSGAASFLVGYITAFILYMAILLYAVNVMRGVIQEKTSRVVEVVISSVKPRDLMAGKIGGIGAVGLLQLAVWAVAAVVLFKYRAVILSIVGFSGAGAFKLPPVSLGSILLVLAYFVLGFFLYSSLYAAIGAMCSSEQDAQQAQTPVVLLLVIPMICMQLITNDPRGQAAQVLTQIPFFSPVLMPLRYLLGGASPAEVALSLGILAVSIVGVVWVASRIYRVGILMYGKRPSLRELGHWLRHA